MLKPTMLKKRLSHLIGLLSIGALLSNANASDDHPAYPDLIVTHAQVDSLCKITLTLKNIGKGILPASTWAKDSKTTLVIERNNEVWHTAKLHEVDPGRNLAYPGSAITYPTELEAPTWYSEYITAIIDPKNQLIEDNKQNNRQNFTIWCDKQALPDEEQ